MGRPRSRSIKSRRSTAQRLIAFERLESRCVLSAMPLGAFGAGAVRSSPWDSQNYRSALVETSLVSSPREHLTSYAAGAFDSRQSFSKIESTADGLSLRPSDSGFSDSWSSPTFGFEYSFKTFQVGGGFYSEFDSVRPMGAGSMLLSLQFEIGNNYSQGIVVYDAEFVIDNSVAMPSVTTPSLEVSPGAASSSMPDTSQDLPTAESSGKATAGYSGDPTPPPHVGRQGPSAAPDAPAISAIPSSESTPATTSPAATAAAAVSNLPPGSSAVVSLAAAQSISVSSLGASATVTLGSIGRADVPSLSDWISMPSPEQSGSQVVTASREVPAPHTAAAGLILAAGVQRTSQAGASLLPLKVAASLVEMPIDLGRIEQTLTATIADIKRLSPDLAGWLNISHVSPLTVAFATAAIGGGSAYYYLRRRGARESNRQDDEESSSWLFSRLHSAASE